MIYYILKTSEFSPNIKYRPYHLLKNLDYNLFKSERPTFKYSLVSKLSQENIMCANPIKTATSEFYD